jgi:two-component system nitrogen regulation sensor histidine kinase NtrY
MEKDHKKKHPIIPIVTIFALGFLLVISLSFLFQWREGANLPSSIQVLVVLNLNIILLLILVLLVFRNLIKLYFEHKKNVLGAKFRTKLILAFVSLSLIPAILLFLLASNLISKSIESWFNIHNEEYLKKSLHIAQVHYNSSIGQAFVSAREISNEIVSKGLLGSNKSKQLKDLIARYQLTSELGSVKVLDQFGMDILSLPKLSIPTSHFAGSHNELIKKGLTGKEYSIVQRSGEGHLIEAVIPVFSGENQELAGLVLFNYYDPHGLMEEINYIKDAFEEFQRRKIFKRPLKMTYLITFLLMTLLIIFSAIWFGIYLAKGITVPIQKLAEGTKEVAMGNLDYKVEVQAKDEIGMLVESFNRMTKDLNRALTGLRQTNLELDQRRRHIETVLANITSGVVTIDADGLITTINPAAERILMLHYSQILDLPYYKVMGRETLKLFKELIDESRKLKKEDIYDNEVQIRLRGQTKTLLVNIAKLHGQEGDMGSLIVFDDLTQLIKAQKIATWQEVARRLAHEIKNPLTPIQLSAERLWKKFKNLKGKDRELMQECTDTIIQGSQGLKTLIDEFTQFARMPEPVLKPDDIGNLVFQTVSLYSSIHPDCKFDVVNDDSLPPVMMDRDQIKRVMINLLDNGYESMQDNHFIQVRTFFNSQDKMVSVQISDWGTGISPEDRDKMTEPYFSRKKGGTGLGLAIVNRIIVDHHGHLMIEDNQPRGTRVGFSLPQA